MAEEARKQVHNKLQKLMEAAGEPKSKEQKRAELELARQHGQDPFAPPLPPHLIQRRLAARFDAGRAMHDAARDIADDIDFKWAESPMSLEDMKKRSFGIANKMADLYQKSGHLMEPETRAQLAEIVERGKVVIAAGNAVDAAVASVAAVTSAAPAAAATAAPKISPRAPNQKGTGGPRRFRHEHLYQLIDEWHELQLASTPVGPELSRIFAHYTSEIEAIKAHAQTAARVQKEAEDLALLGANISEADVARKKRLYEEMDLMELYLDAAEQRFADRLAALKRHRDAAAAIEAAASSLAYAGSPPLSMQIAVAVAVARSLWQRDAAQKSEQLKRETGAFLAKCPKVPVTEAEPKYCSICISGIDTGQTVYALKCEHCYHNECLEGWMGRGEKSCPNCRSLLC